MFYKLLFLQIIICCGLVGLRVYQALPATTLAVGETTMVIKAVNDSGSEPGSSAISVAPATPPAKSSHPAVKQPGSAAEPISPEPLGPVVSTYDGDLVFPVAHHGPDHVISVFGDKRGKRSHQGIDIKAERGTPVVAVTDGFVERIKEGGSGGKTVYLRGAKGRLFYYAHLDDWDVAEYDVVSAGDVLGTVGDTGNAKGTTPHLHFEIMLGKEKEVVDPLPFWEGV